MKEKKAVENRALLRFTKAHELGWVSNDA